MIVEASPIFVGNRRGGGCRGFAHSMLHNLWPLVHPTGPVLVNIQSAADDGNADGLRV